MLVYVMLALCVGILIAMMYRYDIHRREPWYMVIVALLLGALARPLIGSLNDATLLYSRTTALFWIAVTAGVGEELIKLAMVVLLACWARHFDDPLDGIVYGTLVGIGFALSESTLYIGETIRTNPDITRNDLFGQEAIRAVLHFLTGGLTGFGVGLARCHIPGWRILLSGWLIASMLIHFLWDYACGLSTADDVGQVVFQRTAAVLLMLAAMVLFRFAVWVCNKWASVLLAAESSGQ